MFRFLTCLLAGAVLAAGEAQPAVSPYVTPDRAGPERDFHKVGDEVVGPWWQGGGLGVVYFTGPDAQKGELKSMFFNGGPLNL